MKLHPILLILLFLVAELQGQIENITPFNQKVEQNDPLTANEKAILSSKQYQRKKWYLDRRRNPDGSVPNILNKNRLALKSYKKKHPEHNRSAHGSWFFLGPSNTDTGSKQGRVNNIDIHPTNSTVIYLCTPNGGIWKSTTGGFTWSPLTDHLGILSFADLEISQGNPDILYAVSGDGNPAPDPNQFHSQAAVWSDGIYKSTDAGNTWHRTNASFPSDMEPHKLVMHPTNSNIQFLASNKGIYKTYDGWNTDGTLVSTVFTYDIEFHPTNTSFMYASGSNKILVSDTYGNNWSQSQNYNFAIIDTASRIEIAVSPNFPDYIAAMAGNWDSGSIALFTSDFRGEDDTWILRDSSTNIIGAFAHYCIGLEIDPNDFKTFYGGGVGSKKSTNEGIVGSWSSIGSGVVHADIHDIAIDDNKIYIASDGGLFRSTDGGNSWLDLSTGLEITEIYRLSGTESNSELFFIGTQDNGTLRRNSSSTFESVLGSDGMTNIIDYNDINKVYGSMQNGSFHYSTNGGDDFTFVPTIGSGAWITPMIIDPVNPNRLFYGKDSIVRSESGGIAGSWEYIGSPLPEPANNLTQGINNRNRLYASQKDNLYKSNNAITSSASSVEWSPISTSSFLSQFITDIVVDPTDADHVYVTLGGYVSGIKVFESTNGGDSFNNNISGSLPNVPILCMAYHEDGNGLDRLYIGTDIGVFYRDNNIGDWIYFSNYLPAVPVEDLYINTSNNTITAGSYGRGLWRSDLIAPCSDNKYFSAGVTHLGTYHFTYNSTITSLAKVSTQPGTSITYTAGDWIDLKPGFRAPATSVIEIKIGGCPY